MESLGTIHLLDEEPALAELLSPHERPAARRALTADAFYAKSGSWSPATFNEGEQRPFGVLVLDGLVLREVAVAETSCGELVGPGELLRPWEDPSHRAPTPYEIAWKVVQPLRVAVLDADFARVLAMWPALVDAFVDRAVERSHSLALHVAIHCLRRVDVSLLVLFSHLADRFGKMTLDGVVVPIDLTHRDLGKLVGATRQSISTALADLADRECLFRRPDGSWLMQDEAPEELEHMLSHRRRSPESA
jgi:CRP/FNR family cyclic AMP-dependent transcriptional regulator